jgi:hypothetical protein
VKSLIVYPCILIFASSAAAQLTYTADNRAILAQNSFGASVPASPSPAFSVFNTNVGTPLPGGDSNGTCSSSATQNSTLSPASMSGVGSATANANVTSSSPLVYGGGGTSTFLVSFTTKSKMTLGIEGQLGGPAGKSTLSASIQGASTLFTTSAAGVFSGHAVLNPGVTYTVQVKCAATVFATWAGTHSASSQASWSFTSSLTPYCAGDLNYDGQVDDQDFVFFAAAYNLLECTDPNMPLGCPADLNGDGAVDDTDFTIFAAAYNTFVCP